MVIKNQRGITIIALVITIVIIIILATVTINMAFGDGGLLRQAEQAKDMTANSVSGEGAGINSLMAEYANVMAEDSQMPILEETKANEPVLTANMTPIKWNGFTEVETNKYDEDWYSYERQSGSTENGGTSRWANAKNSDGSYFVWIPRYAYKITYYTDSNKETISEEKTAYGDIDIVFLEGTSNNYVDKNGVSGTAQKIGANVGADYTNSQKNGDKYTVHPAFTNGTSTGYANGEWDEEVSGIWIAKYEMSMETNGVNTVISSADVGEALTSENSNIKAVSKPGASSWRLISIGNCYLNGLDYEPSANSHTMKNSEWGAMAYLTYSEYGRNGTKVTINNSSSYITGSAGNTIGAAPSAITNAYNTDKGVLASTTGNIYGIYDTNGGLWATIMAYITCGNERLTTNAGSFTSMDSDEGNTSYRAESTKYATAYPQGTATSRSGAIECGYNYWNKIYGDAVYEVSVEAESATYGSTMYNDGMEFDSSNNEPFFIRGGCLNNGNVAGSFMMADFAGSREHGTNSFRVVLIP